MLTSHLPRPGIFLFTLIASAVPGFSYFDIMTRLKANSPDDAWKRLNEILTWLREVKSEGSYRAHRAKPGRGTLQSGGPPGGLGMDHEFYESVLVPTLALHRSPAK